MAFGKLFESAGLSGGVEALLGWRVLTMILGLPGLIFYLRGRHELLSYQESIAPKKDALDLGTDPELVTVNSNTPSPWRPGS
jgi:hypothetical protein